MIELSTELNAINVMLGTLSEAPINSLEEGKGIIEVDISKRILDETTREVQSMKLSFNTYIDYELQPNSNNEIELPANTLRVKASRIGDKFVQRGSKLFNRNENSYEFKTNAEVELSLLIPFEEMPEIARYYVIIRASRKLQQRVLGSETLYGFTIQEEEMARQNLFDFEADVDKYNIIDEQTNLSQMFGR